MSTAEDAHGSGNRRRNTPAPTIYDIARLAGVNPSTVSRALSKPGRISIETEKRIREAAATLGYRVNPMARALPTGRTSMIGLIVADITNPVFFDLVRAAERAAAASGYTLVFAESQESEELEAATAERIAPSVDALILLSTRLADEQLAAIAERKPLVAVNRFSPGIESVVADIGPGIDQALTRLRDLGHQRIAYLSGPANAWMSGLRERVLLSRAASLGMSAIALGPNQPTVEGGAAGLDPVRESTASAVFAFNDLMAIGLLRAAHANAVAVPRELSVVGFDDIFGSDFTQPPLSTIRTPLDVMGELAFARAHALITGSGHSDAADPVSLATRFVERGSTGPTPT